MLAAYVLVALTCWVVLVLVFSMTHTLEKTISESLRDVR